MPIQMAARAPPNTIDRFSSRHNPGIGIQIVMPLAA